MSMDALSAVDLSPDPGDVVDEELAVTDDVLVKVFALGPDAELEPHTHAEATNVFHVVDGTVVVTRGDESERLDAPAVVVNERGQTHGARNPTEETALLTAGLSPFPG